MRKTDEPFATVLARVAAMKGAGYREAWVGDPDSVNLSEIPPHVIVMRDDELPGYVLTVK